MEIKYAEGVKAEGVSKETKTGMAAALERLRTAQKMRPLTTRENKRQAKRNQEQQTKRATRSWRASKIQAIHDESTVLGLGRVHLLGHGTPAMRQNVAIHVRDLEKAISASQNAHLDEAHVMLQSRMEDVLRANGEIA